MKITVLCENTAADAHFLCEHGLSLYIETDSHKLLFDMGQTDVFFHNAKIMNLSLADVDYAVLSHGHYDHGGGLSCFFEQNKTAPVFLSRHAFGDYYNAQGKYIGLDKTLQRIDRMIPTDECTPINNTFTLFSCNALSRPCPASAFGLTERHDDQLTEDRFLHEQYLLIHENGKRVLVSGCSHKGIQNIVRWFRPDVLIGGFHQMKVDCDQEQGKNELKALADDLMKSDTDFYTCHCTGQPQYDLLKTHMQNRLHYLSAGSAIII